MPTTAVLRVIGRVTFLSQLLPVPPPMGQSTSKPTEEERRQIQHSASDLYRSLKNKQFELRCPITHQKWLSPDVLHDHVTLETVQACTSMGSSFCGRFDAENAVENAKKAFALLILCRYRDSSIIEDLLEEGLIDDDLPLEMAPSGRWLVSAKNCNREFKAFSKLESPDLEDFLERQWLVLPPVFDETDSKLVESPVFHLDNSCPLPLKNKEHLTNTETSSVSKCELHPLHYRCPGTQTTEPVHVAVKEIFGKNKDDMFEKEIETLSKMRQFNNRHLIRHIAACRAESDPPLRCIIFPFASGGDLRDYWSKCDDQPRTSGLVRWALSQMHGLATAVRDLHAGFPDDPRSNVRHGDLKPQNILIFADNGQERRLVIADVGIAKVHMGPTAVRTQKATGTLATTRAYEAPEAHHDTVGRDRPRSRTYDIWSLGCIFLEFTIWLLFDVHAVDNFAAHRPKKWTGFDGPGGFYEISDDGNPRVCEQVRRALTDLLDDERCGEGTALGRLVRLIEQRMIVAEVEKRVLAEDLVALLDSILSQEGNDYFLKSSEKPVSVPEMFRKPRTGSSSSSITR